MPKKKEKKGSDKVEEEKKNKPETSGSEDKDKILYLTHIQYLDEQLERYQLKCSELEKQKKLFDFQYEALEAEKKDITDYLKRSLLEKEDEVEELLERLESLRQATDQERDSLQLKQDQMRQEHQEEIVELTRENRKLVTRLASLEEFESQREQLMSSVESLERRLASETEDHRSNVHSLEMKALLQKKSFEKEMESHAAAMEVEVQNLVNQKVPEMTRLTLQENTELREQFIQLTEQAQVLLTENSGLKSHVSRLTVDVENLEQMLSEVSRKACIHKKVVEQLTEKCQQLQEEVKQSREENQQLQNEHDKILNEMKTLRQDETSLSAECSANKTKVKQLEERLQVVEEKKTHMKNVIQEAADILRQTLMEAAMEQNPEEDTSVLQWKQLMQKLLVVLNKATFSGLFSEKVDEPQACRPSADEKTNLGSSTSVRFELARHRPGDLGFVPPAAPKHFLTKTRHRLILPLSRKPPGEKTSSLIN
ncbi:cilia- and flagella-associated protein 157 [Cynoglossus semilaevis]|uniref:Cilia- and flagella-associated protein 157 n=1 Tax=Cynoglossus semilaevis TaxID=244447 RepID=A0A3P8WZX3_CYNSE|nr:cilia- and flagella-associated protein 157 [Cynoglossus semilaevis]XP_008334412.1 cilia- and flagella-associated protein 157 [Cynoglossus semilaevis]